MTRDAALRRIQKLDALADPARGGTDAERALAREKAAALRAKFSVSASETRKRPAPRRRVFRTTSGGAAWAFNVATGEASSNVRVEHWNSPGDWKIEIPL